MAVRSMSRQAAAKHFGWKGSTINPTFQEEKWGRREVAASPRSLPGQQWRHLPGPRECADSPTSTASSHHSCLSMHSGSSQRVVAYFYGLKKN